MQKTYFNPTPWLLAFGLLAFGVAGLSIFDMLLPRPYDGVVLDADSPSGLTVREVLKGSGAELAGIRGGDQIRGIGRSVVNDALTLGIAGEAPRHRHGEDGKADQRDRQRDVQHRGENRPRGGLALAGHEREPYEHSQERQPSGQALDRQVGGAMNPAHPRRHGGVQGRRHQRPRGAAQKDQSHHDGM